MITAEQNDYMFARYYSSGLARFLAVDPELGIRKNLSNPQKWNRYVYAQNNPVAFIDPDGRDAYTTVDANTNTVNVTVNIHMTGPAAIPDVAAQFSAQANASWGGEHTFTASGSNNLGIEAGTTLKLNVNVVVSTDSSAFPQGQPVNTMSVNEGGSTETLPETPGGTQANRGNLNVEDLERRPGVAGHETGHFMGLQQAPAGDGGIMEPTGSNPKPSQSDIENAGNIQLKEIEPASGAN